MTTSSSHTVPLPAGQSGQEVYDEIMRGIDVELTSDQIPLLAEKYKDESKDDRVKRVERYNKAFASFDIIAAQHEKNVQKEKNVYRKQALASAEAESRVEESKKLQQLESQFS
jgi:hypothetical protein